MLIAASTSASGRNVLIVGLMSENITRLRNDQPIRKNLGESPQNVPGLEEWDLVIIGPEDTVRFAAHFGVELPTEGAT
jgi:hypothetical protein